MRERQVEENEGEGEDDADEALGEEVEGGDGGEAEAGPESRVRCENGAGGCGVMRGVGVLRLRTTRFAQDDRFLGGLREF